MPYDRFLVGFVDGNASLQTDLRPFLINDNAFTQLQNVYVFRGRVRKRFGSTLMGVGYSSALTHPLFSRAAVAIGTTSGAGNIAVTVPGAKFKVGQLFSIGNEIFTVSVLGVPGVMLTTGASTVHTFNTTTGAVVINGAAAATNVYYYPAEPIMGITIYERGAVNNQPSYAFDTQFAYFFNGFFWDRAGNLLFTGNNLNYVWTCNWTGITDDVVVLFVTNFNAQTGGPGPLYDPIWSTIDGTTWVAHNAANAFYFKPAGGAIHTGPFVATSRIIVAFKNRLVLLSTIENDGTALGGNNAAFPNRCRYSHNGSPFAQNAWYEPNQTDSSGAGALAKADGAGFVDATTTEAIISAAFIKDRLIVFFERSTWELAYTGNQVLPFVWQKLNTELGSQSTFSSVPFDKEILTIGSTGIHSCNGVNVTRIDNKIPDEIFEIGNGSGGDKRVYGIRDYFVEQVYWTFPSVNENPNLTYPNQVLVYNYKTNSWALNDDCITAFGYFEEQTFLTWATVPLTWEESNFPWNQDNEGPKFRQIIAGNQQGFLYLLDPDVSRNANVMQITNITASSPNITLTVVDHTLSVGEYVMIENAQGVTGLNGNIYVVVSLGTSPNIATQVVVGPASFTGAYTGGGTLTRVSNTQLMTKQYNFYLDKAQNIYFAKADFGVLKTTLGQITVDYFPSSSNLSMLTEANATNSILGNGVLETSPYDPNIYPFEQVQDRLWHSIYFQTNGDSIQLAFYLSSTQITNPGIAFADFELQAVIYYVTPSGRLQ